MKKPKKRIKDGSKKSDWTFLQKELKKVEKTIKKNWNKYSNKDIKCINKQLDLMLKESKETLKFIKDQK